MYKLLALDIDGTTYNENHQITDVVRNSILNLNKIGVNIAFISGREESTVLEVIDELGIECYYSALNGSIISNSKYEKALHTVNIGNDLVLRIIKRILAEKITPIIFTEKLIFTQGGDDEIVSVVQRYIGPKIEIKEDIIKYIIENNLGDEVLKIGVPQEIDVLRDLNEKLDSNFEGECSIFFSLPFFMEIMPNGIDKGYSIKKICEFLNISTDESVVMGDGENDIPMFREAGLSVAMGNSMSNVKDFADMVTDTNRADGVAKAIEKIFK